MRIHVRIEKGEEIEYEELHADDFYHEIDYVIRTWLEHKYHHTYPESGSYNDQDAYLMKDWHTMNVYYSRVSHGDFAAPLMPKQADNWQTLMKD